MTEAAPKFLDNYGRQAEIRKAHEENMTANKALIGQLADLTSAIHRLAKAQEAVLKRIEDDWSKIGGV
jgi:hypothetical protein